MFNRDGIFGKKDETGRAEPRTDTRGAVNISPGAGTNPLPQRPVSETPRPDLRFADPGAARAAAKPDEPSGSRLIVGPDIKLRGVEITDCDTLVVEGRVEASMDSRVIQIAENGVFSGTVSIDVAEIRGRFEGELTARKQLLIHASGRVSGRIRYGTIRIEEGGEVSGEISTLSSGSTSTGANPPAAIASTPGASSSSPATPSVAPATPATPAPAGAAPASASPLGTPRKVQAGVSATLPEIPATPVVNAPPNASRPQSKNQGKAGAGINTA
jgi:cytoskeletal protein CcmA (bactofilin family)